MTPKVGAPSETRIERLRRLENQVQYRIIRDLLRRRRERLEQQERDLAQLRPIESDEARDAREMTSEEEEPPL